MENFILTNELDILSKPNPRILDILDQVEDDIKWSSIRHSSHIINTHWTNGGIRMTCSIRHCFIVSSEIALNGATNHVYNLQSAV